jgi:hypothetical protein
MMVDRMVVMTNRMMYGVVNGSVGLGRHGYACDGE